jgi:hypothetical protein
MLKKSIYILPLCSLLLVLNGCSSNLGTHAYNEKFGLVENLEADKQLEQEEFTSNEEHQAFEDNVNTLREFKPEKGTFLAEDWVQPEPVIEYLYPYDPKFYREDELPENKGRLGNVIVKVPDSMTKEEFLSQLESGEVSF